MNEVKQTKAKEEAHFSEWGNDSLWLLYEMSNVINNTDNHAEALEIILSTVSANFNATSAILRLITDEGWMDLVSSTGLTKKQIDSIQHTAIDSFLFSQSKTQNGHVNESVSNILIEDSNKDMLAVPVRHHNTTLGTLNIIYDSKDPQLSSETARLLITIGELLGQIVEKQKSDAMARQKLIQEERNMIANELHDSLAQTLASLRFQVRILDETLQLSSDYTTINSIEQVEHSLDEAYTDLRELIAHCRAPIDQQGLIASIGRLVNKFKEETDTHILLQCECQTDDLPPKIEMNAYRIVQESLTNIKKHGQAHIVRVLLGCDDEGNYRILIENDGIGFDKTAIESKEGEHLGLTIMQERANQMGGELKIESEPEEGTRIELRFTHNPAQPT